MRLARYCDFYSDHLDLLDIQRVMERFCLDRAWTEPGQDRDELTTRAPLGLCGTARWYMLPSSRRPTATKVSLTVPPGE
jgi:hypothetical protein